MSTNMCTGIIFIRNFLLFAIIVFNISHRRPTQLLLFVKSFYFSYTIKTCHLSINQSNSISQSITQSLISIIRLSNLYYKSVNNINSQLGYYTKVLNEHENTFTNKS